MSSKIIKLSALVILTATLSTGCIIHVGNDGHRGGDLSSVFGQLEVGEGKEVGDISSVNGSVQINKHVTAEHVSSVNGNMQIASHVSVQSVETVNGRIEIGSNFIARGSLSTVNGEVSIQENSSVGSDISTVNGDISLDKVAVAGDLSTHNGDIYLRAESNVAGDIVFEEVDEDSWGWGKNSLPSLHIDASSTLAGKIILKRKVSLHIEDKLLLDKVDYQYNSEQ